MTCKLVLGSRRLTAEVTSHFLGSQCQPPLQGFDLLGSVIQMNADADQPANPVGSQPGTRVTILFCTQCKWLLRAAWMAQELLSTFGTEINDVALRPGTGGVFRIEADGELIWDRVRDGGFPDVKILKRLIRDMAAPGRDLGHADRD